MSFVFIWFVILGCFGGFTLGDRDCSQPPAIASIFDCCHRQVLLNKFGPKCAEKLSSQLQPSFSSPFTLCLSECIFKEGELMGDTEIVIENSKRRIQNLYNTTPEFIPIMTLALEKCDKIVKETIQAKDTPPIVDLAEDMCHPVPAIIAQCTLLHSFLNCPKPRWEDSDSCNDAMDYLMTCRQSTFKM